MKETSVSGLGRRSFLQLATIGWLAPFVNLPDSSTNNGTKAFDNRVELIVNIDTRATTLSVKRDGKIDRIHSMGFAGMELNQAVIDYFQSHYNLKIGRFSAEKVILELGSALPMDTQHTLTMRGRSLVTGLPHAVEITNTEVQQVIEPTVRQIASQIVCDIRNLPAHYTNGRPFTDIILTGDFGQLKKLDQRLQEASRLPVTLLDPDVFNRLLYQI